MKSHPLKMSLSAVGFRYLPRSPRSALAPFHPARTLKLLCSPPDQTTAAPVEVVGAFASLPQKKINYGKEFGEEMGGAMRFRIWWQEQVGLEYNQW